LVDHLGSIDTLL
jgi:hypothetical protein